jgi:hypothetical protein
VKPKLGREVAKAILEALGAPAEDCIGVDVELPINDFATLTLKYRISSDMLIRLGDLLKQDREHL